MQKHLLELLIGTLAYDAVLRCHVRLLLACPVRVAFERFDPVLKCRWRHIHVYLSFEMSGSFLQRSAIQQNKLCCCEPLVFFF